MKVSVLLLTYNEAGNLPRCLASLDWCDDIVVVDSGSSDETVAIAGQAGATVLERPFDNFANQRNFGLENHAWKNEWVLHLDADEVSTPEFQRQIENLQPEAGIDAYHVPSKTMLHEHWLKHAGMYPTYQVRLGHRERLRFKQVGHGQREDLPADRVGRLAVPYLHYNFSQGLEAWLRKHVAYARDEAKVIVEQRANANRPALSTLGDATERRRFLKWLANRMPLALRPPARFFYMYVLRRGFLDGRYGFLYALMVSTYEGMIAVQAFEVGEQDAADR